MDHRQPAGRPLEGDPTASPGALELRDYLAVLRRRRWTAVLTATVVLGVVVAVTLWQVPMYESSVRLLPDPAPAGEGDGGQGPVTDQRLLATEVEVMASAAVAERVAERLDLQVPPDALAQALQTRIVGETNVVEITARSPSPDRAAELAQGFAEGYLELRREQHEQRAAQAVESLDARIAQVRDSLAEVQTRKAGATDDELRVVEQEEAALLDQLRRLSDQLITQRASQGSTDARGQIIRDAQVPTAPSSPDVARNMILAVILGTVLGLGMAFLRDSLDDGLRSDQDVVRATGEPVVGRIPAWRQKERDRPQVVILSAPTSAAAEAYRSLRTNIRFLAVGRSFRSLLVTSALQGEGKTTTASNLAVAFALAGGEVLLVGADLRRSGLHRAFDAGAAPGLSDVLAGDCAPDDAMVDVGVPNLRLIPSGNVPPNPAELLGSEAMASLMDKFEKQADLVVYDGPPVLATADALELSARVGAVLLVVDGGAQRGHKTVQAAADHIRTVGGALVGAVMTKVDHSDTYYGSGYGSG